MLVGAAGASSGPCGIPNDLVPFYSCVKCQGPPRRLGGACRPFSAICDAPDNYPRRCCPGEWWARRARWDCLGLLQRDVAHLSALGQYSLGRITARSFSRPRGGIGAEDRHCVDVLPLHCSCCVRHLAPCTIEDWTPAPSGCACTACRCGRYCCNSLWLLPVAPLRPFAKARWIFLPLRHYLLALYEAPRCPSN